MGGRLRRADTASTVAARHALRCSTADIATSGDGEKTPVLMTLGDAACAAGARHVILDFKPTCVEQRPPMRRRLYLESETIPVSRPPVAVDARRVYAVQGGVYAVQGGDQVSVLVLTYTFVVGTRCN